MSKQSDQPQWQPIGMLSTIATHIDGMLEAAEEQLPNLEAARPKPFVLDDFTVKRVIDVFSVQRDDLWIFDEQLNQWKASRLTAMQRKEVERLAGQMQRLHEVIAQILEIADELKQGTIEKQLAKSDLEVGMEALFRQWRSS